MKRILGFLVMLLVSLVIVACGDTTIDLDTPTNVVINNGIVTWDAVEDAEEYRVVVGTNTYTVTTTTFDLNTLELAEGSYQVTVVAVAGDSISLPSSSASYVVDASVTDPDPTVVPVNVYAEVLAIIDETYVPNMTSGDFTEEWEFEEYQRFSSLATAYSSAIAARSMTAANAIGFFAHIKNMAELMPMNASGMMDELDTISDFDMTTEDFAYIAVEIGLIAMGVAIDELVENSAYRQEELGYVEDQLETIYLSTEYTTLYNDLAAYTTAQTLPYLDGVFTGSYEYYYYIVGQISYIASELLYNYDFHDANYFLTHEDPAIQAFYEILLAAKMDDNTVLLGDLIDTYEGPLSILNDVYMLADEARYLTEEIENDAENIVRAGELLAYFTLNKPMLRTTIQDVADYMVTVYGSITPALVTLLDDAMEFGPSMEEIFLIKDEVVMILHTTLPDAEYFGDMYYFMFNIANALSDFSLEDFYDYTTYLGQLEHAKLDILLSFAAAVDQQTVEDVMMLVDEMVIPGEEMYDPEYDYWYYTDDTYDFEKVVEFAVYVGTFFEDFKLANETKFTTLETLLGDESLEELLLLFGDLVKQVMAVEMDEDEYAMAEFVIDEILADYDNIVAGLSTIYGLGVDVFAQFLATDGQFFIDFYLLTQSNMEVIDQATVAEIESVFAQLVDYNNILAAGLTQMEIEKILTAIRVPLMIQTMMEDEMFDQVEFNLAFAQLVTPVSTVIANFIYLENQLLTIVTGYDVAQLMFESSWNTTDHHALMGVVILALDDLFTTANETLFFDTITMIGNDILSNAYVMGKMGTTQQEIDDMIGGIESHFQAVFTDLHMIAAYDFTALTEGQILEIEQFFDTMFAIFPEEQTT
ncbi:MAG: hypothetical protein NUK62_03895 [Tenericutes bacterium]|nr:hypothetical protein [Mycoplasmatota bacterium]